MLQNRLLAALAAIACAATMIALANGHAFAMDNTLVKKDGADLTKARALIKAENWPVAIAELKRLEKAGKPDANVYNLLGFSLRKQKQFAPSFAYYQKALKLDPKHLGAHVYLGELYIQTGKLEKAMEQAKVLAKLCPKGCKESKELQAALTAAGY